MIDHLRFDDQSGQSGIATRSEAGERVKKVEKVREEEEVKRYGVLASYNHCEAMA